MGYAKLRKEISSWKDVELRNLEGGPFTWSEHIPEIVSADLFDSMGTGLYVLNLGGDSYFTCHSLFLEYFENEEITPCDDCGDFIFTEVHDAEMGMCLKCSNDYFRGDDE